MQSKKVLVTGAAGFIGSRLVMRLSSDPGTEVIAVDKFSDYYSRSLKLKNIAHFDRSVNVRFIEDDLLTMNLPDLLDGIEVVFHQAGQPGVRPSWGGAFESYVQDNIIVTQRLLEASLAAKVRRFVYASSSSVYGNAPSYPVTESTPTQPESPYGVTKLAGEHLVSLFASNFALSTVSLRYFTVYGPGQRPDMAFTRMISSALQGESLAIFGDGEQSREFTYVDDVVNANVLASERDVPLGSVLNIAGGSSVTLNSTLELVENILGRRVPRTYDRSVPGDVGRTGASAERAQAVLGWTPKVSLDLGLREQAKWVEQNMDDIPKAIAGVK